jgi:hypothetical protein
MSNAFTDCQQVEEYTMEQFYAQRDELFALIAECEALENNEENCFRSQCCRCGRQDVHGPSQQILGR